MAVRFAECSDELIQNIKEKSTNYVPITTSSYTSYRVKTGIKCELLPVYLTTNVEFRNFLIKWNSSIQK